MTQTAQRVPARHRTLRVPHSPAAVTRTRRAIVDDLRGIDVSPNVVDEVGLVVSELLGNAVRHASPLPDGRLRVRWQVKAGVVELDVTDGGARTTPTSREPSPLATSGRGLRIVRSLAHEWGVSDEAEGRTVWVTLGGPSRRRLR